MNTIIVILIINICKEKLHYPEFVKPIVDVIRSSIKDSVKGSDEFFVVNIHDLNDKHVEDADKIIISGTSLQDFDYSKHIKKFDFLKSINKPVLGICGGMQIICQVFGCKIIEGQEIGLIKTVFDKEFLGMDAEKEVYALHNMAIKDDNIFKKNFDVYSKTKYVQAIKHKAKPFYGVLFHPEVRNKDIITKFLYL